MADELKTGGACPEGFDPALWDELLELPPEVRGAFFEAVRTYVVPVVVPIADRLCDALTVAAPACADAFHAAALRVAASLDDLELQLDEAWRNIAQRLLP